MKFRDWINEETTTGTTGSLGADSVTSNKKVTINIKDDNIKKLLKDLKKKGVKQKKEKDGTVTLDLPYETPKSVMKQLSKYSV